MREIPRRDSPERAHEYLHVFVVTHKQTTWLLGVSNQGVCHDSGVCAVRVVCCLCVFRCVCVQVVNLSCRLRDR